MTFAITHYERPEKLVDAIFSAIRQTYRNIELIVIDDGSSSKETKQALEEIEQLLARINGKLIRQDNSYLGAARNTALQAASGEYICYLDDDDIARPDLIEKLMTAAESGDYDVVNCLNIYMNEAARGDVLARSALTPTKVSYVPLGGPLSLTPTENCLGAATALFKKSALIEVGGYTEIKGVGHEDYELFIRLSQIGKRITIVPIPLYFYEIGRPSMLSRTSMIANFRRCFNSLDLRAHPTVVKDIISLATGKKIAIDAHNRQHWLYSQSATGAIRNKILTERLNRVEMLDNLIKLASAENNQRIRFAFEEDLSSNTAPEGTDQSLAIDDLLDQVDQVDQSHLATKASRFQQTFATIRMDISLGRQASAINQICDHLENKKTINRSLLTSIAELIFSEHEEDATSSHWNKLSTLIRAAQFPRELADDAVACALCAAGRANNFESAATIMPVALKSQNEAYLNANPDVARAVNEKKFRSGIDHFVKFGFDEGREGFDLIRRFIEISKYTSLDTTSIGTAFSRSGSDAIISELFRKFQPD